MIDEILTSARLTLDYLRRLLADERFRPIFPTVGHAVLHDLTAHAAVHVGQVSAGRRAAGYPPSPSPSSEDRAAPPLAPRRKPGRK